MDIFNSLKNYLGTDNKKGTTPEGYCPNCWGRQEYEGHFLDAVYKEEIDLNNINEKKGWIQAYAAKNLVGIKLEHTKSLTECPSCKLTYKELPE